MLIALCLFKYFPYGGLQRDFLAIGKELYKRGHQIRVYTRSWQGDKPSEFDIIEVPVRALTNHSANVKYYEWVKKHLDKNPVDKVVGFNKMPGLDFYYAADVCYAEKVIIEKKSFLYKLSKRYHQFIHYESEIFKPGSLTKILALTKRQIRDYQKHYRTESSRFYLLPPGISKDRKYQNLPSNSKNNICQNLHLDLESFLCLQIGSDFYRKGVDRSIIAISSLPENIKARVNLIVIGQDNPQEFIRLAKKLHIENQVHFFYGRDDIPQFIAGCNLLLHPARSESAGIVILEALIGGLPEIVTSECGYSTYVAAAKSGIVLKNPFKQDSFNKKLLEALTTQNLNEWKSNACNWADNHDMYSLPFEASTIIEEL